MGLPAPWSRPEEPRSPWLPGPGPGRRPAAPTAATRPRDDGRDPGTQRPAEAHPGALQGVRPSPEPGGRLEEPGGEEQPVNHDPGQAGSPRRLRGPGGSGWHRRWRRHSARGRPGSPTAAAGGSPLPRRAAGRAVPGRSQPRLSRGGSASSSLAAAASAESRKCDVPVIQGPPGPAASTSKDTRCCAPRERTAATPPRTCSTSPTARGRCQAKACSVWSRDRLWRDHLRVAEEGGGHGEQRRRGEPGRGVLPPAARIVAGGRDELRHPGGGNGEVRRAHGAPGKGLQGHGRPIAAAAGGRRRRLTGSRGVPCAAGTTGSTS